MHFRDGLPEATFSFEFFPPRSAEAAGELFTSIADFQRLRPNFVSVTYGAGGSTRDLTHGLVERLQRETGLTTMPHLACLGHSEAQVEAILARYAAAGIKNLMALRGDPPRPAGEAPRADEPTGPFSFAADLVRHVRRFGELGRHPDPRGFGIGVAGYPEGHPGSPNRLVEMDRLKAKVDAGADVIVTQLFFDNRDFYDFRDRCALAGIRVPVLAGIMPVTSIAGMRRMSDLALGARFPASLIRAVNRAHDDEGVRRVGVHWATEQCRDLLDHQVAGIHFYTLNRSTATREIYATLGVRDSRDLARG